jgi:hypothetical protein
MQVPWPLQLTPAHDGADGSKLSLGTTDRLSAVWGTGPDEVFVVGYYGTILRHGY